MTEEIKLRSRVVSIGEAVEEFLKAQILVFFQEGAPEELAEFSVLHAADINTATVAPGDTLFLGQERFDVLAVGEVANQNLAQLGHLVVKANGASEAEMLGDVCVSARPLPRLHVDDLIEIRGPLPPSAQKAE